MRLEQLQYFIEVARHRSISRAAHTVFLSQPALSAAIKGLENEIGRELFLRTKKGLFLTDFGMQVYDDAVKIVAMIKKWHQSDTEPCRDECISLACTPIISHYITPKLLVPFQKAHPHVRIQTHGAPHSNILRTIAEGHSPIILTTLPLNSDLAQKAALRGWTVKHIFTDTRELFMGQGNPYAAAPRLTTDMLKEMDLAYYSDINDQVSHYYAPYFRKTFRLANKEDILDLVIQGKAVFIQPSFLFSHDYRVVSRSLVSRQLPRMDISADAPVYIFASPSLTPMEQALSERIIEDFAHDLPGRNAL